MFQPLTIEERAEKARLEIDELEKAVKVLIPLRRYYKQLVKIRDGGEPEVDADKENTQAVDEQAGAVSEDQPR